MRHCIHFSQLARFVKMERGLGRYGFRQRKGKGGYKHRGGKRARTKISPRNMFINQLGGWSANKTFNRAGKTFEFTSPHKTHTITVQSGRQVGSTVVRFNPGEDILFPVTIFPKFQKWRLKKLEFFYKILTTGAATGTIGQLTIAKWRDEITPNNLLAVPGAQTKMMTIKEQGQAETESTELDVLRCACFWPPVSMQGEANPSGLTTSYLMSPYMDGEKYAAARFNAFGLQWTLGSNASNSITVSGIGYFKSTWIAYTPTFEQI